MRKLCQGLVLLLLAGSAVADPATLEQIFRNPQVLFADLSPDGQRIAAVYSYDPDQGLPHRLVIIDVANAEAITEIDHSEMPVWVKWATSERLVYRFWKLEDFGLRQYMGAMDPDGLNNVEFQSLFGKGSCVPFKTRPSLQVIDWLRDDPQNILVTVDCDTGRQSTVYKVDILTGLGKNVGRVPEPRVVEYGADRAGRVRAAVGYGDDLTRPVYFRSGAEETDESWRVLLAPRYGDIFRPMMFTVDNRSLYVASNIGRDRSSLLTYDPETGQFGDLLFEHDRVDLRTVILSRDRARVLGVSYDDNWRETVYFDDRAAEMYDKLRIAFPGQHALVWSFDDDLDHSIARVRDDRHPGKLVLLKRESGEIFELADLAPWIMAADLPATQRVRFAARDGLELNGYLTLPLGEQARELPLVIRPHDAPLRGRVLPRYSPTAKFLASEGYAVLELNYRGSTGSGRRLQEAGFGQLAVGMVDDLADAASWAAAEGIADATRVCVWGENLAGYLALMAAARHPERFRCAITQDGISDLRVLFKKEGRKFWVGDYLELLVGTRNSSELHKLSPVAIADQIVGSILLIHSASDPEIDFTHAKRLRSALAGEEKVFEIYLVPYEAKVTTPRAVTRVLNANVANFLSRHLN